VDFRGTVLLPESKGDATVESKRGRTEIEAHFERVPPPARYGREYLTYVLWAISPEGHARNLGEVLPGSSDKAKLRVTTDLQAFGMIVTAEPYSAVRLPSNVVVLENEIRPDTLGKTEPVQAKYELLPRGNYMYQKPVDARALENQGEKLPFDRYEARLEVYQALNAVQIAQSAGAAEYAPDTLSKAEGLLSKAQSLERSKVDVSTIVTTARQAAQTADDARTIAVKRKQDGELAKAQAQLAEAQQRQAAAEQAAQKAQAEAAQVRATLDQERAGRTQADQETAPPPPPPPPAPPVAQPPQRTVTEQPAPASSLRHSMLRQLNTVLNTRDTPRGIVVTLPDNYFHTNRLQQGAIDRLYNIASILRGRPGLNIQIEGFTDDRGDARSDERLSFERANAVRTVLVRQGLPQNWVIARGLGKERPIASNATPTGREQNRRVEILISGEPLGSMAGWERSYTVTP
jgi:outer membrane protein OmpA-like peptidoglycan-associated protein